MKQAKWFIGLALVVGLIIGGVLVFSKDDTPVETGSVTKSETTDEVDSSSTTINPGSETSEATAGKYVDYSEDLLTDQTIGTKILFFHAPWCPQCRELEANIKAGEIPSGVTIIKVDYDDNQSLRSRYGVTIQTTLVRIDSNGNLVKKYVAYDEPSLESLKENLL